MIYQVRLVLDQVTAEYYVRAADPFAAIVTALADRERRDVREVHVVPTDLPASGPFTRDPSSIPSTPEQLRTP